MKTSQSNLYRAVIILAGCFILFELYYAFQQYLHSPFDGDFLPVYLPTDNYRQVLQDPFGFGLLKTKETYSATNRFFSHFALIQWFNGGIKISEIFSLDPAESLFITSAAFSWLIHIGLSWMLLRYISVFQKISWQGSIIAYAFILSFFHFGTSSYMQIALIDHAVTYTFFYGLPVLLLLLFYWPFYKRIFRPQPFRLYELLALAAGVIVIPFFGGFMAPLLLFINGIVIPACLFWGWRKSFPSNSKTILLYLSAITIWALYSFYIGSFNNENASDVLLTERYFILFKGLVEYFTYSMIYVWIAGILLLNYFLLRRSVANITLIYALFIGVIALYIFSLPLGGYRHYRPWIIRYDVMTPVTLLLIWAIISGGIFLLKKYQHTNLFSKLSLVYFIFFILFGISDYHRYDKRDFQKKQLQQIQNAENNSTVFLNKDEPLLIWFPDEFGPHHQKNIMDFMKRWKMIPPDKEVTIIYQ